jgi:hypothetical protein
MLDSRESKDEQVELIKVLQGVTEGKIFVEIDRARLTKRLAKILEAENKKKEAADAMQEVAVETFGAMHRSEKIAYVLEQMRLCMDNSDFIRAQILSRKVLTLSHHSVRPSLQLLVACGNHVFKADSILLVIAPVSYPQAVDWVAPERALQACARLRLKRRTQNVHVCVLSPIGSMECTLSILDCNP